MNKQARQSAYVLPAVRILIMIGSILILGIISKVITGKYIPTDEKNNILFQSIILLIILGSSIVEPFYTKPVDSFINSLMGIITLLGIKNAAPFSYWMIMEIYCVSVFIMSLLCIATSTGKDINGWKKRIASITYQPSVLLGQARLLYSVLFMFSIITIYTLKDPIALPLVIFWGIYIVIWPLKIPQLFSRLFSKRNPLIEPSGEIIRIDNPNILRISFPSDYDWSPEKPEVAILPDGKCFWVQPLYKQFHEGHLLATGLLSNIKTEKVYKPQNCVKKVQEETIPTTTIYSSLGGHLDSLLVGYVVEDSTIGTIRFETLNNSMISEGMMVWAKINGKKIYYQIVDGETHEETFTKDKHGFQIAKAIQIGEIQPTKGFVKYEWLPMMNTPMFASENCNANKPANNEHDFILGKAPKTEITIGGNFCENYNQHTAILGVTGSGKTELAFDIIKHAISNEIKVFAIDLTSQYERKLESLSPKDLSITEEQSLELEEKIFKADTGKYGGGDEKRILSSYTNSILSDIETNLSEFLSEEEATYLGLLQLRDISNTKATLWLTELYLTCLLKKAREHQQPKQKILIVVEEAHTVMPEASTMGLGDFDSRGLVGKIAQIALQGRKYGVGLLVLAQRTATVSKSVLTQCNSIISFRCYDDTSINFLKNIYGSEYVNLIPNLPKLHAIGFGPWIRSERPIVFEIPYDEDKAENI